MFTEVGKILQIVCDNSTLTKRLNTIADVSTIMSLALSRVDAKRVRLLKVETKEEHFHFVVLFTFFVEHRRGAEEQQYVVVAFCRSIFEDQNEHINMTSFNNLGGYSGVHMKLYSGMNTKDNIDNLNKCYNKMAKFIVGHEVDNF